MFQPSIKFIARSLTGGTIAFSCLSCEIHDPKAAPYPDLTFNSLEWKGDTTGCLHYRERASVAMAQNERFFRGKSAAFLFQFLGCPTYPYQAGRPMSTVQYTIECTEIPPSKVKLTDSAATSRILIYSAASAASIMFYMRQDTCTHVGIIEP